MALAKVHNRADNCHMAISPLKIARKAAGLSLEQLSEDVGISVSQLSRFESGKREPRVAEISRIAERLGVKPTDLFDEPPAWGETDWSSPDAHRGKTFLRQWRESRDLTQVTAAERIGMDPSTLSRIERGEVPYNQDFLERAALAYGCDPADLLNINPLAPDAPRLIYNRLKKASPEVRQKALEILEAYLKTG